jgi:hypothetical protein
MPKFRLRADHAPVDLFEPSRSFESFQVEPGGLVDVPGDLVTSRPKPKEGQEPSPLPDDAFIVLDGGVERAWPKAVWELDKPAAPAASPVKEK